MTVDDKIIFDTAKDILLKWIEKNSSGITAVGDSFGPLIKKVKEAFDQLNK
jgi:hypothetical protein